MTSSPLLTIGAFARAVGLTASALRHYDECGLLPPAEVDDATGYRYYTPDLADRARLIVAMREAGVPIEVMRRVLDGPEHEAGAALATLVEERVADAARTRALLREVLGADAPHDARARVEARVLASALRQVRIATERDPASPLSAVLIDVSGAGVDVVATNRYWMAIRSIASTDLVGEGRVVLGLAEAARLADRLDDRDEVDLEIVGDGLTWGGGLPGVDGRTTPYPAHRLLVDGLEPPTTEVLVAAAELGDAVGRTGRAEVGLEIGPAGILVGADEAPSYAVPAAVRGPAVTLWMGSALLRRALGACLGPEVLLEVVAGDRAVRLSSPYQPGFLALVMPAPR